MLVSIAMDAASGYEGEVHEQLTFIAAKQFNRCVERSALPPLTPIQLRYVVKANVRQANANLLRKLTRWSFYDRSEQAERTFLWTVDTRLHEHFNRVVSDLERRADGEDAYSDLGRVVSYLQDMTSPVYVVPVYFTRWWRWSFSDRFDSYPVDDERIERAIADSCTAVLGGKILSLDSLLRATAEDTLEAVRAPVPGLPATWQVFWELDDEPGGWGEYGPAGNNFGRRTEFDCGGERCLLLEDDPLYRSFAFERHERAVLATMRAMRWLQSRMGRQSGEGIDGGQLSTSQ